MKKVAILQSNYIPWKGYFDMINSVDEFVLYDTAQYTKNDWRNRNKIKNKKESFWLTIPVSQKSLNQKINETIVSNDNWRKKHWKSLILTYGKAKYFKEIKALLEPLYLDSNEQQLSFINFNFIKRISSFLEIKTKIRWSNEFELIEGQSEKLLGLCKDFNANIYLSGPAAKNYLDEKIFMESRIKVEWIDYSNYPKYNQFGNEFKHEVSILDLLFHEGPNSYKFMKSF
jgi:hypothetical protein